MTELIVGAPTAWHAREAGDAQRLLRTSERGLTAEEAAERLARHGRNEVAEAPPPSDLAILIGQFRSPLLYILAAALAVSLVFGELVDAAAIGAVLALDALIGFFQERQAERSVRALRGLLAPKAEVVRGGSALEIDARELVPGDLVLLSSGARVPADLRLLAAEGLLVDESLLTGESTPVLKGTAALSAEIALADRTNMAYSATTVSRGRGRGFVVATGDRTEVGTIAAGVRSAVDVVTPLQRRVASLGRLIGVVAAASSLVVFGVGLARGEAISEMFRLAVALAVAAVPEGLPVAFTITLAIGVRRMARRRALVRRLGSVETLGSTTVIGSDKTGTLTENRMTVSELWAEDRTFAVGEVAQIGSRSPAAPERSPLYLTLLTGVLASEAHLRATAKGFETVGDPTEAALLVAAAKAGLKVHEERTARPPRTRLPFEPERQYSASVHDHEGRPTLFAKGAPERILAMCDRMLIGETVRALEPASVRAAATAMAARGLRVLAMAFGPLDAGTEAFAAAARPRGLIFLGLQGMLDPPRAGVREAVAGCRGAGVRVLMITGDHAETARSLGRDLGIGAPDAPVLTGGELERLSDEELGSKVGEVSLYARVSPTDKLRIVRALRSRGEVVAVTGDGVNDAPALKAADIGVSMGRSGTDVAREASDIVLADDNFVSIYAAVEEGRITFDNLRKITHFLVSTGVAEVLTILGALGLGWPLILVPAQILWLNLVTEGLQDVALAFEPGEPDVLARPPRPPAEGILSRALWERTALVAVVMAIGTLVLFGWSLDREGSLVEAQSVALTTMVLFQTFQVGNARSDRRSILATHPLSNPFLFVSAFGALGVHVAALYWGPTQLLLRVEPIAVEAWPRIVLVALGAILAAEAHKTWRRWVDRRRVA